MQSALIKSLKDIFSIDVIKFIVKVAFSSFVIMIIIFAIFWQQYSSFIASLASYVPFLGHYSWFNEGVAVVAAPFIAYGIILALISLLTSIFSPKLLIKLAKKHYGIEGRDNSKISEVIKVNLKATLKFFGLTILLLPALFVPILGQIVMLLLWAVLLKEPTEYDIKSLFNIDNAKSSQIVSIIAASFNYIPILNVFSALFAQILFLHFILSKK